ncbi:MAG: hypothetical protein IPF92_26670 [Myxococcales bacterium]|nr:hypothetical protein [Myxococcales bacterium]MBL0194154.1 hypothetical protein [Myxococcales bacterium]HQY60254.1 hypothetical protein [Polyangiaceae bacterium]
MSSRRLRLASLSLLVSGVIPFLSSACATGQAPDTEENVPVVPTAPTGTTPDPTGLDAATTPDAASGDSSARDAAATGDVAAPAPVPVLTSLTPPRSALSATPLTIKATGSAFTSASVLHVDGTAVATTFTSATELQATLPASLLATVGTLSITVTTPAPGGGTSAAIPFAVENPAPTATTLAPLGAVVGSPATTLTITGTGFVSGAKVVFNGVDLVTTFGSSTSVQATIPAPQLATPGTFNVTVVNPAPGGGTTAPLSFTVSTPAVQLTSVTPVSQLVGSGATAVSLVGTGFLSTTSVMFNGVAIGSTYVDATHMNATIPAGSLTAVGDFPLTASNPPPGGGLSNPVQFRVQYAAPNLVSLAPSSAIAGSGPVVVSLNGSAFYSASQVSFDGVASTTTFVSSSQLRATLTAAQLATGKVIAVRVSTPAPGGGTSAVQSFTVQNPGPTLTGLSPSTVAARSAATTVTLTGNGFVTASQVRANGADIATTFVSGTSLTALVPASFLLNPGAVSITVANPNPGGGTSGAFNLNVACNTAGVDVALGAIGNTTTLSTSFAAAPTAARLLGAGTCPASLATTNPQPARYWVVQNTAGVPIVLSSWAVCTSDATREDDAFLTYYRRSTRPATDAERQACTGFISEGLSGNGGYTSPEAGGSDWCPGLTKSNGGAIALGVCETAVVHIQPWSLTSTTYSPPASVRLRPEAP